MMLESESSDTDQFGAAKLQPDRASRAIHMITGIFSVTITMFICLVGTVWVARSGLRTFFREGVTLGGDGLLTAIGIREFVQAPGWNLLRPLASSSIGWPEGYDSVYFPGGNWIEASAIKFYSSISGIVDPTVLLKTFAVGKTLVIAATTWWFGRALRLSHFGSFTLAFCYSLSTFNIIRAGGHFGLGMTWGIPLILLAIISGWRSADGIVTLSKFSQRASAIVFPLIMFAVGLSGFYYSIFGLILFTATLITVILSRTLSARGEIANNPANVLKIVFGRLGGLVLPAASLAIGFLLQVLPSLVIQRSNPPLVASDSRSWTESIVYSGSHESLLFDIHAFVFRILDRPDVLAFLESRATWEARQVGAIAGFVLYVLLMYMLFRIFPVPRLTSRERQSELSDKTDTRRLLVLLFFTLCLYFVGPFGFGLSNTVLPAIRAWGRTAPIITLLTLALLLLRVERVRIRDLRVLIWGCVLLIQVLEVDSYRRTFPESRVSANAAIEARRVRESTIADLARVFDKGCPIALLPIYPFPEYDSPNDANGDYGLFDLPLWDNYGFRWSYGAIKNTAAARHYAPFISQQPPFARASLTYQIQYWAALRPCGAVIDRSYLYAKELEELETIRARGHSECLRPLMGEKFNGEARFIVIDFSNAVCQVRIDDLTSQLVTMAIDNEILWQPITVGITRYERYWAMIPAGSPHQLMYSVRGSRPSLEVLVSVLVLEEGKPLAKMPIELCITSQQSKSLNGRDVLSKLTRTLSEETTCHQLITSSAGLTEHPITLFASDELHSILSVTVNANTDTPLEWGAILRLPNPDSAN